MLGVLVLLVLFCTCSDESVLLREDIDDASGDFVVDDDLVRPQYRFQIPTSMQ